ncbi:MAG: class I SAM-dependent methyltransferase [Flavobacteriales bacterium]|nr:class I SAM-dependent methyltransferase [Flavobacteriales bacterium]
MSYFRRSVDRYGVHSPFLFDLIENVFRGSRRGIQPLESIRQELLKDNRFIELRDYGAGSSSGKKMTKISDIARHSLSSRAQCMLLHRLISHLDIKNVLEFGSSLGLSSAYMASSGADVISMEGSSAVHKLAEENFGTMGIDFRLGTFDDILNGILAEMPSLDMAFIDGNHRRESTIDYFNVLLDHISEKSVLVFDDIHWSRGMEEAWHEILKNDNITLSVDLFWCGMVFFRPGLSGEHFTIRY